GMLTKKKAQIDRRVQVVDPSAGYEGVIRKVSDLRAFPFVVLLGEPGMGKSTVLEAEATLDGTSVLTVRKLMTGGSQPSHPTLYLDALDEYRLDGQPSDKIHALANAVARTNPKRWRLSCRSEDWRKGADLSPISETTSGEQIVVAQLMPLNHTEASAVLVALDE